MKKDTIKVKYYYAGFDIVANRVMEVLVEYMDENHDMEGDICFWVTGHSMGGGVANLVFAAPNTFYLTDNTYTRPNRVYHDETVTESYREPHGVKYRCIFNVVNDDDFVPKLPMEECEWTKYGRTASLSVNSEHAKNRSKLGINHYYSSADDTYLYSNSKLKKFLDNYNGDSVVVKKQIVDVFTNIFMTNNMRKESYEYNKLEYLYREYSNHSISKNASPFQYTDKTYSIMDIDSIGGLPKNIEKQKVYVNYQMPEYLFEIIANAMHENDDNGNKTFFSGMINKAKLAAVILSKKYAIPRNKMIEFIKYLIDPHYVESYYALSKMIDTINFK